jgi:hypothetical protein
VRNADQAAGDIFGRSSGLVGAVGIVRHMSII